MARIQMDLRAVLLEIHGALFAHALIGGLALAAHGAGRATADLGLLADGERAEDVDRILREHGYECLLRNQYVGNYLGPTPERGLGLPVRAPDAWARHPRAGRTARDPRRLASCRRCLGSDRPQGPVALERPAAVRCRRDPGGAPTRGGGIEALRQVFGDPELDRRPWRGNDFRL